MGIRFYCPNGHKLNVKSFQAGRKGICPYCGSKFAIPHKSTRKSSKEERAALRALAASASASTGNSATSTFSTGLMDNRPLAESQSSPPDFSSTPPVLNSSASNAGVSDPQKVENFDFNAPTVSAFSGSSGDTSAVASNKVSPVSKHQSHADPLMEAGDVVWYVRPPSGGQYGPATNNIMRQWLVEGRISPDTLVWHEGWREWQKATAVFPQLRSIHQLQEIEDADSPFSLPLSSIIRPTSVQRNPQQSMFMIIFLVILAFLLIASLIVWAINRESSSPSRASYTPSTHHVLCDKFNDCDTGHF